LVCLTASRSAARASDSVSTSSSANFVDFCLEQKRKKNFGTAKRILCFNLKFLSGIFSLLLQIVII
jgi:hypothetical protein